MDSIHVDFILFLWLLLQDNCHWHGASAVIYLLQMSQKPSKGNLVFFYADDLMWPAEIFLKDPSACIDADRWLVGFFFFFLNAFQYNKHQTPRISLCGWKSLLAVYPHVFRFKTLKNVTHWVFSPCCFEQNLAMWMPKGGKLWFHLFALYLQLTFSRCVHTVPVFGCNFACKTLSLN